MCPLGCIDGQDPGWVGLDHLADALAAPSGQDVKISLLGGNLTPSGENQGDPGCV